MTGRYRRSVAGRITPPRPVAPAEQVLVNFIALAPFSGEAWRNLPGAGHNRQAAARTRGPLLVGKPAWMQIPTPRTSQEGVTRHVDRRPARGHL